MLNLTDELTQCDREIATLTAHKDTWLTVSIADRIPLLRQCMVGVQQVAEEWVKSACVAKGIDPDSPLAGEDWMTGPIATLSNLRSLMQSLQANGQPQPPRVYTRPDGQVVAQVLPANLEDTLLWPGFKAEVWMQPGQDATQGLVYRQKPDQGQIALVLGAGNVSAIAALDSLYKLFAEDQVVLLKMNPVNAYVGPWLEHAFQPLIKAGVLQIVYGGVEVGQYLCQHEAVDTIHITGSHHTHDAIVWGTDPTAQRTRKAQHHPQTPKPITSELGNVTPVMVVPGQWSAAELQFQARHVASMVTNNASFNCIAAKVLITAKGWPLRERFLQQVRAELAKIPPRQAYYPGAEQRYQAFLDHYPQAQVVGKTDGTTVPWTVIPDVPAIAGEYALTTEAFCGVLAEVSLEADTAETFLARAVEFVNHSVWGNLACVVLIDPRTQRRYQADLERAIAQLRYGTVAVNVWAAIGFTLPPCPWGAFPGNPLDDIASGQGVVHNTYLFEQPQKTVLYAPFQIRPTPLWFAGHKTLAQTGRRYAAYLMNPDWKTFLGVLATAIRG